MAAKTTAEALHAHIDTSFQAAIIALCCILMPMAPILVGLRFLAKRIARNHLVHSDYFIIASCITLLGVWIPIIIRATWPLTERGIGFWIMRVECLVVASTIYLLSSYLCRVSILFLYYELLRRLPYMGHVVKAAAAWLFVCFAVSLGVQVGVGVEDVRFVQADLGPSAVQEGARWKVYGILPDILGCVCDLAVFAIPLPSLMGLRLSDRRKKAGLLAAFMVGFVACVFSLVRVFAWKLPGYVPDMYVPSDPYMRRDAFELLYPMEVTFGILGASLPMLRPLFYRAEFESRWTQSESAATRPWVGRDEEDCYVLE